MSGPGVAPVRIPEIDEAAAAYVKERDKRVRQTPREVDAKKALIGLLHSNEKIIGRDEDGVLRYEFEGLRLELRYSEEKLKVSKIDDDEGE